jgi:ribulose 1,5-bisphosphate synthetase/thiazole synthase
MYFHRFIIANVLLRLLSQAAAKNDVFDYVIVGGGGVGMSLASRLSENVSKQVAVLEAGNTYVIVGAFPVMLTRFLLS